jgi:NADH-quinone oxidoreductase subunit H
MLLAISSNPWLDAAVRLGIVALLLPVGVIWLTWLERKVIGRLQQRLGPMRVGPYGLLQGIADTIKLITKEDVRPVTADRWVFELAPFVIVVPVVMALVALPFTAEILVRNMALGLFYIVAVTGLSIVGMVMAGWGSDNKYALLGAVRAGAQLISYEVPLILTAVAIAMLAQSMNLQAIVSAQHATPFIAYQPLGFIVFSVATLAELYRQPFDIPVAESEVVGGATVEYSGIRWSMFQLSEFASLVLFSILGSLIFLGGWTWPLDPDGLEGWVQALLMVVKVAMFIIFFMWMRGSLPRLRIDQLMALCWQVLLPFTLLQIMINGLVLAYDWPDWTLSVLSGAGAAALIFVVYQAARREGVPIASGAGAQRIGSVL